MICEFNWWFWSDNNWTLYFICRQLRGQSCWYDHWRVDLGGREDLWRINNGSAQLRGTQYITWFCSWENNYNKQRRNKNKV